MIEAGGNGNPPYGSARLVRLEKLERPGSQLAVPFRRPACSRNPGAVGNTNYAFSHGDSIANITFNQNPLSWNRGMFLENQTIKISMVTDGTSNTIAMSEHLRASFGQGGGGPNVSVKEGMYNMLAGINTNPGLCLATAKGPYFANPSQVKGYFGTLWTDGETERLRLQHRVAAQLAFVFTPRQLLLRG